MKSLVLNKSHNPYIELFRKLKNMGLTQTEALIEVTELYLSGKPTLQGKHKITRVQRDNYFWSCDFLFQVPDYLWDKDVMRLALSQYLSQLKVSAPELLLIIARQSPDAVCCAIRYARMALNPIPERLAELKEIARQVPDVNEQCLILDIFHAAYQDRQMLLASCKERLSMLSVFELMIYASLYAFEHMLPSFNEPQINQSSLAVEWVAVNELFIWKLSTQPNASIKLTDTIIGRSIAQHLAPFIFPFSEQPQRHDLRHAFTELFAAQIEMLEFIDRSVDAYSYDDAIRFVRKGSRLDIEVLHQGAKSQWNRESRKMAQLYHYWTNRAVEEFIASGLVFEVIGLPENYKANRLAYIKAIRDKLQLEKLYGIDAAVLLETGESVDVFKALLSLELTSIFYQQHFLQRHAELMKELGINCLEALGILALNGLLDNSQNRFPLTFSTREEKVQSIVGWTVDKNNPKGSVVIAAAILDFWTSDWVTLAAQLKNGSSIQSPQLFERPYLKLGQHVVLLPWITGLQSNSTAAINNLRRIGARRAERKVETDRIENQLGDLFASKGFRVIKGWQPDRNIYGDAGEVDLICVLDDFVLVIEVKSSYLRSSARESWLHGKTTLRKAGLQLKRKVSAVKSAMLNDIQIANMIGVLDNRLTVNILGWIIDTSIEHDHKLFSGFPKFSVEEIMIALRDERHLLVDRIELSEKNTRTDSLPNSSELRSLASLYPEGFSAARFVDVIMREIVWEIVRE